MCLSLFSLVWLREDSSLKERVGHTQPDLLFIYFALVVYRLFLKPIPDRNKNRSSKYKNTNQDPQHILDLSAGKRHLYMVTILYPKQEIFNAISTYSPLGKNL